MTTVTPFTPSAVAPFQFQPTLDGAVYTVIVTWNLYARRFYINVYDLQSNLIFTLPLIGSPLNSDISLTKGYFTSTLVYREPSSQFEVNP